MRASLFLAVALLPLTAPASAERLSVRQVSQILATAKPGMPPDVSGADLGALDLSDLDFKGAKLAGANLYGANLARANLAGADLRGANLDHTIITKTNFAGA